VLRYCSNATYGSVPASSALRRMFFTVWIARSACPLDCAYLELDVVRLILHSSTNSCTLRLLKGILSESNCSGIPCLAKISFRSMMTVDAVCLIDAKSLDTSSSIVHDQDVFLLLEREDVCTHILPRSVWNWMWQQRLGCLLTPKAVARRKIYPDNKIVFNIIKQRPPRYTPAPLPPRGRRSALRRRADGNVAAIFHGQHVPTPTAAAA